MRKCLFVFLAVCLVLSFSACDAPNATNKAEDISPRTSFYSISTNEDLTYSYQIVDKDGVVLFSDNHSQREPHIEQISDDVYSVTVQTGTGRSTNWAVYCNVENGKVSETFQYVLGAQGDYVFFVDFNDGVHSLVVQNIFDSNVYQKTYTLKDCGSFADPIVGLSFESDGKAIVSYLTGSETMIAQTSATIYFP